MELHQDKVQQATLAADAIGDAIEKKLSDIRPAVAAEYDLDDQLVTLAITKAAVAMVASAASQATGMGTEKVNELEDRLYKVVYEAMDETPIDG
jgi:regulator of sigma D